MERRVKNFLQLGENEDFDLEGRHVELIKEPPPFFGVPPELLNPQHLTSTSKKYVSADSVYGQLPRPVTLLPSCPLPAGNEAVQKAVDDLWDGHFGAVFTESPEAGELHIRIFFPINL